MLSKLTRSAILALVLSLAIASVSYAGSGYDWDDTYQFCLTGDNSLKHVNYGSYYRITATARSTTSAYNHSYPSEITVDGWWYMDGYAQGRLQDTQWNLQTCSDSDYGDFTGPHDFEIYTEHTATFPGIFLSCVVQDWLDVPSRSPELSESSSREEALSKYHSIFGTANVTTIWDIRLGLTGMDRIWRDALGYTMVKEVFPVFHRVGDLIPAAQETASDSLQVVFYHQDNTIDVVDLTWCDGAWLITR